MPSDDEAWSTKDVVDLVLAVSEAHAWVLRPYNHTFHRQPWESAFEDLKMAISRCGPNLTAALGTHLSDVVAAIHGTPQQLANSRVAIDTALKKLRTQWAAPPITVAAWLDLADACQDLGISSAVLAYRRDLFMALVRTGGRSPRSTGQKLAYILADKAAGVTEAKITVGDIDQNDIETWPRWGDAAGLNDLQRLALCKRLLSAPPRHGHHVVWLAFDQARIHAQPQVVGPITFYESQWVSSVLTNGGPWRHELPTELTNPASWLIDLPESPDVVIARVDLGAGAIADPVGRATDLAYAAVAWAKFHTKTKNWKAMDGYLQAIDGRVLGFIPFAPSFNMPGVAVYLDGTGDELARLGPDLGSHLLAADRDLHEAIEMLHWWHEAGNQSPLPAILLDVRIIEFVAARTGDKRWYEYLDRNWKNAWIRSTAINRLLNTCIDAARNFNIATEGDKEELKSIYYAIVRHASRGRTLHADEALKALPMLRMIYPVHSRLGRLLASTSDQLSNCASLGSWSDELEREWKAQRERLQRIRNALAHSSPVTEDAAKTVAPFCRQMASWALDAAMCGILDRRGVQAAHDEVRSKALHWRANLSGGSDVAVALFR
ncbi:hypothetical protein ACLQ29_19640 [Micromonospora sp. DT228]|uniref:hypothetical protein n=1 Tax=Micromonospora sp. DT228 TaxID=3393443 RepID=UPI003CF866DC